MGDAGAKEIHAIAERFRFGGKPTGATSYGSGHIHDTYLVNATGQYILQRINTNVFPDPAAITENLVRVTRHLRRKLMRESGAVRRQALQLIAGKDGDHLQIDDAGGCWRAFHFIAGAHTNDVVAQPRQAYEAARAFAHFAGQLVDLPGGPLHETIPDFHHTPKRFATFRQILAADPRGRAAACRAEIDFALAHEPLTRTIVEALDNGALPRHVSHNDCKLNNVMMDDHTDEGVCVIDLDTVMPGTCLYDFGDLVRTSTSHFAENEKDLAKVRLDMKLFTYVARGYLAEGRHFMTAEERHFMVTAGRLITFETGMRFLTDYLAGDTYFKISYPDENLDRCRTQFAFVADMERQADAMEAIIRKLDGELTP